MQLLKEQGSTNREDWTEIMKMWQVKVQSGSDMSKIYLVLNVVLVNSTQSWLRIITR